MAALWSLFWDRCYLEAGSSLTSWDPHHLWDGPLLKLCHTVCWAGTVLQCVEGACTIASLSLCQPGPVNRALLMPDCSHSQRIQKMVPCVSVRPGTFGQLPRVGPWKPESATPGHWAVIFIGIGTGLDDSGGKSQVQKAQATSSLMAA